MKDGGLRVCARNAESHARQRNYCAKFNAFCDSLTQLFEHPLVRQNAVWHDGDELAVGSKPIEVTLHEKNFGIQSARKAPRPLRGDLVFHQVVSLETRAERWISQNQSRLAVQALGQLGVSSVSGERVGKMKPRHRKAEHGDVRQR